MTTSASATLHYIAHRRSKVLLRTHGHLHCMCTPFVRWDRHVAGYRDDHTRQISSFGNLTLHKLLIVFQRFDTWAAMLHYYLYTRDSWMVASMHEASQR